MQQPTSRFNFASAMCGFAIGTVITFIAVVAFVPTGGRARLGGTLAAGDGLVADEGYIEEGTTDDTIIDAQGNVVRTGGGKGSSTAGGGTAGGTRSGTTTNRTGTAPSKTTATTTAGRAAGTTGSGADLSGGSSGASGSGSSGGGGSGGCATGQNDGATDTGVTATQILLGATVVDDGIAESFLGQVRQGMEAQLKKVNRTGGICGRQLKVVYKNDGWEAETGARYIQNLIQDDKVFALAVSPSSEGLNQASKQNTFRDSKVPVIGADGLNVTQFKDPFIFPVAAATVTTIDVMMKDAWDRSNGTLRPAVVYGDKYRFGIEGAYAANAAYQKLANKNIPGYENPLAGGGCDQRFCGISPSTGQYTTQIATINESCRFGQPDECNFLILLLEPATALQWQTGNNTAPVPTRFAYGIGAPQPLFTYDFAQQCGDKCDRMRVWTGYNPPIGAYASNPAVAAFVEDLRAQSASADRFNQFTMGGYIGMGLMIEALKQVGSNLTRAGLVAKLNSMEPYNSGLAPPLQWRPDARYANHSAQAFEIQAQRGFTGTWTFVRQPLRDPWLGEHAA